MFLSDEGPTLETLDFAIYIGSTPTFFKFRFTSQYCLVRSILDFMFLFDEGPTFETLDFAIYIGSTPTFFIFRFTSQHCLVRSILDFMFLSDEGPTFETLDFAYISICIFQHYVYINMFVYLQE